MGKLTFYFDRNFGRRFPEALQKVLPSSIEVDYQHSPQSPFKANTPDDVWLAGIGANNWIVFTHDRKFHELAPELSAIKQHSIGCFYLWGADALAWEKLRAFARGYDNIIQAINMTSRPFIFQAAKSGHLQQIILP